MNKKMIIILGLILVLFTCAGCGNTVQSQIVSASEANNRNIVAIVGNHSQNLIPNYNVASASIQSCCMEEGSACVIVADGDPYVATGDIIEIPERVKNLSSAKVKAIVDSQTKQLLDLMETSYAKAEEVDLLRALDLASREVNSSRFVGKTDVYIFDSGVSTKCLNMTMLDLEHIDTASLISILQEKKMIPDLSNCGTIHWVNITDVSYELSNAKKEGIKEVWKAVINAGGAEVEFMSDPATEYFEQSLPYVSKIPNTVDAIMLEEMTTEEIEEDLPIVFSETEVGFNPGKTSFIDEALASQNLTMLVDFLNEYPDKKVLIAGTTADWGSSNYQLNLSMDRAETVKKFLVSSGISEDRIVTIGLGSESAFYKYDKTPSGELDSSAAASNRLIIVMDLDGELATKIIAGEYKRGEMFE